MFWKNWPSWLKGGMILAILYFIVLVISLSIYISTKLLPEEFVGWIVGFPVVFIIPGLIWLAVEFNQIQVFLIISIFNLIPYFIMGSFIGLILGRIKSRRLGLDLGISITIALIVAGSWLFIELRNLAWQSTRVELNLGTSLGLAIFPSVFIFIIIILIGVLIGWIIRKIKSKKQQPVQTQPQIQSK